MFQTWRIKLREAQTAFQTGRLGDAARLLSQEGLKEFLPARRLSIQVATQMAERGRQLATRGDTKAGWRDWEAAATLEPETEAVLELRQHLIEQGLDEVRRYLAAGEVEAAAARLKRLEQRQVSSPASRALRQVALHFARAQQLSRQGMFSDAEQELGLAAALEPGLAAIEERREACRLSKAALRPLVPKLHECLEAQHWGELLRVADELLELAPEFPLALEARRKAWLKVSAGQSIAPDWIAPCLTAPGSPAPSVFADPREGVRTAKGFRLPDPTRVRFPQAFLRTEADNVMQKNENSRFVVWVDAVGGFLVCPGEEIVLGQAGPGSKLSVPIFADLSRRHATIRRDAESYLVVPDRSVRLNGQAIAISASLVDGAQLDLGDVVKLKFSRPHPLSATAKLRIVSGHRTQPAVDAVVLMAESCILGPQPSSHIVCPSWPGEVVIYRTESGLFCRTKEPVEIDGVQHAAGGPLTLGSRVAGESFSFSLEAV